jgi:Asp/Glu/hydantoin racemase
MQEVESYLQKLNLEIEKLVKEDDIIKRNIFASGCHEDIDDVICGCYDDPSLDSLRDDY